MLSILFSILYVFVFTVLISDSFRAFDSSIKFIGVESNFLAVVFLTLNIVLAFMNVYQLPKKVLSISKGIFCISSFLSVIFILLGYIIDRNIIFRLTNIQVENFITLPLFTGGILYINYAPRLTKEIIWKKLIFFIPPLFLFTLFFVDIFDPELFKNITSEDRLFENAQFLFFFLSSAVAFLTALFFLRKRSALQAVLFLGLAVGLFFISGEEISWGQRIIGFETPYYFEQYNLQKESTFHNIGTFHRYTQIFYMVVGLYGALSRVILTKFFPRLAKLFCFITPPTLFFFYFFAVFLFYFLNQYLTFYYEILTTARMGMGKWQEVAELYVATGFLLFTLSAYKEARQDKKY